MCTTILNKLPISCYKNCSIGELGGHFIPANGYGCYETLSETVICKVGAIQNSNSFYFSDFHIWLDATRRAESEYIYYIPKKTIS
jgi:hypothetical protein